MPGIEIPIGAPLDQLTKDLKGANTQIKNFENQTNSSLNRASISAGKSTKSFTDFNRVIQDLPYGIVGISNNLQQLIPNIGLASVGINILLTAVTFAQTGFANWTRGINFASKALDNAKLSGDEYAATLNAVSRAQLQGSQAAQAELTTLQQLYKAYQSANLPLAQRKDAYEQLQKQYPDYFGNLKFEATASDKTTAAYNKLTAAILATARARAASEAIAKNAGQQLENESKIRDIEANLLKATNTRVKAQEKVAAAGTLDMENSQGILSLQVRLASAISQENALLLQKSKLVTANNKLTTESLYLQKEVTKEIAAGGSIAGSVGGEKDKVTKDKIDLFPAINMDNFAKPLKSLIPENSPLRIENHLAGKTAQETLRKNLAAMTEITANWATSIGGLLEKLNLNVSSILEGGIVQSFESLGTAIGSALSGAGNIFNNLGNALLSSLGSVLGQLGQMAIATGVAILGIKTALKTLNPFAAIAAGVALLAISGVVRGAANRLGSSMGSGGGSVSAASPGSGVNVSNATASGGGSPAISGGTVVFEISGVNLYGVLNRAGYKLARIGPI